MPTEKEKWAARIVHKAEQKLEELLVEHLTAKALAYQGDPFASDAHFLISKHQNAVAAVRKALEAA